MFVNLTLKKSASHQPQNLTGTVFSLWSSCSNRSQQSSCSSVCKRLIILDGLDGSRLSGLQQRSGGVRCHQEVLGQCSSAMPHLGTAASPQPWIASRLAAANQIPPLCVSRVTEAQGFTDSKNEEYFKRIFNDEVQQNHLLHSRASLICVSSCSVGSLLGFWRTRWPQNRVESCQQPWWTWLTLLQWSRQRGRRRCTSRNRRRVQRSWQRLPGMFLWRKLWRLTFKHLRKGNIMFYKEDLDCGICQDLHLRLHLSIQQFLSAVYMIHCDTNRSTEAMGTSWEKTKTWSQIQTFLRVDNEVLQKDSASSTSRHISTQPLGRETGHLNLFVFSLHGLSVKSNQRLLGGLQTKHYSQTA